VRKRSVPRARFWAVLALALVVPSGCISPLYTWDTHTASITRPLDVSALAREPVATLGVVAPGGLQGFTPMLAQALTRVLGETSMRMRATAPSDVMSALNERGLTAEYADLLAGFGRTGILERERMGRIASALNCRYLLLPGLTGVDHTLLDKFEFWGFKFVRSRVIVLRLWLQLWDAQTGRIVRESAGEITAAGTIANEGRTLPVDELAQKLWRRMIEEELLAGSS
jgi:hypothetical protein